MQGRTVLLLVATALVGAALAAAAAVAGTTQHSRQTAGKLVFCVDTTYPPAEYLVGGTATGYDIDIANAVGKELGLPAQIKTTGFDVIIPALLHKKCDAIISSMTITPQRSKQVHFTPYITVGAFLMVKKGNPAHISTLASLSGHSVAVEAATTEKAGLDAQNAVLKKQGKAQITIKIFPADTSAAAAILAGKVDAYFADSPPVLYYIKKTKGKFQTAGKQIETAPEGIASRKGDPLGAKIDTAVSKLYASGTIKSILTKWDASQFALKK
jgi:polar amino acid transport system substrate-binding protein